LQTDTESTVAIVLPNSAVWYACAIGALKLGACVLPLNPRMTEREMREVFDLAQPHVALAPTIEGLECRSVDRDALESEREKPWTGDRPFDVVACPAKMIASGGSTGRPKLIVDPLPWAWVPPFGAEGDPGLSRPQVQLVAAPLYHNFAFRRSMIGLFNDHQLVVMERFDAAMACDLIERHRVSFLALVPTMMKRMADLGLERHDLSSVRVLTHSGGPCAPAVKRAWIHVLGPELIEELYGNTEWFGQTSISGQEWLAKPGSVGRAHDCDIRILRDSGAEAAVGEVGEIAFRNHYEGETYRYLGAPPVTPTPDGFLGTGDLGYLDNDGYLFLSDRRVDMIVTGGVNVYPAEVEAVLLEHPAVGDAAVVGLDDAEWGQRVHAVVELRADADRPRTGELAAFAREKLSGYKVPRSFELVDRLPRSESGKIQRASLRDCASNSAVAGDL
jgi:bile acid-coenzyme A ligase